MQGLGQITNLMNRMYDAINYSEFLQLREECLILIEYLLSNKKGN